MCCRHQQEARSRHIELGPLSGMVSVGLLSQVDVVVGFSNSGEEAYNVSAIQGSLHSAAQWNLWVQNFTLAVRRMPWHGHPEEGLCCALNATAALCTLRDAWLCSFCKVAVEPMQLQDLSLKPGEQGSLQYKFKPDRMLQPREFLVALHVFYNVRANRRLPSSLA